MLFQKDAQIADQVRHISRSRKNGRPFDGVERVVEKMRGDLRALSFVMQAALFFFIFQRLTHQLLNMLLHRIKMACQRCNLVRTVHLQQRGRLFLRKVPHRGVQAFDTIGGAENDGEHNCRQAYKESNHQQRRPSSANALQQPSRDHPAYAPESIG